MVREGGKGIKLSHFNCENANIKDFTNLRKNPKVSNKMVIIIQQDGNFTL